MQQLFRYDSLHKQKAAQQTPAFNPALPHHDL
jgi:hypothetical protein